MPTVVIRRTQVIADRMGSNIFTSAVASRVFESHAIGSAQIGSIIPSPTVANRAITGHAIGSVQIGTILPTAAVAERALGSEVLSRRKLSYFEDVGSAKPPSGGSAYISFSRTFAVAPYPSLTKKDSYDESAYPTRVTRVVTGSMFFYGSPDAYVFYRVIGSA